MVLSLSLALAGCVGATERGDFEAEVQRRGGGVTTALVAGPLDRLRHALGVDDPQLLSLLAIPGDRIVVIEARDPDQPRHVDRYRSANGGLGSPEPVQVSARDDLDGRSFRVSDLPVLDDLESVADAAIAALGFAGSYVTSISTERHAGQRVLVVQVSSPRAEGTVTFSSTGDLLSAVPA